MSDMCKEENIKLIQHGENEFIAYCEECGKQWLKINLGINRLSYEQKQEFVMESCRRAMLAARLAAPRLTQNP